MSWRCQLLTQSGHSTTGPMRAVQFTSITCGEDAMAIEQLRKPERNIDHEDRIAELCREVRLIGLARSVRSTAGATHPAPAASSPRCSFE